MGAEILVAANVKDGVQSDVDNKKLNDLEEPIKLGVADGSNGTMTASIKVEEISVPDANFPKDAVDEWPAPKQIHSFYFVRCRSYEDPQLKVKIEQADKDLQKKNQTRFQLTEALKAKKSDRAAVISHLKPLTAEGKQFRMIIDERRKDMEPLQAALGKMRLANNAVREKGFGLCSSEEELNELIQSLHYRIQHESNTLAEEKQLLKEIKQLEASREKVIANSAMKAKLQDSFGEKGDIQDQLKLIGGDLDGVRKEQLVVRTKIKQLEDQLKDIETEISELQQKLTAETEKRDKAYETLSALRKKREEGNGCYYENRSLLNKAKEHAAKKDIKALEELSQFEMEKFMSLWSSDKGFRADYERRILPSLDSRQLSRDGRMRNPDEKPLTVELPSTVESQIAPAKANTKFRKEDAIPLEHETVHEEVIKKSKAAETKGKVDDLGETENFTVSETTQKESPATNGIDAAELKEMKRKEEIAKAKLALERKKKLAEKAAAKAAVRAQKEAEKKLKEREKKAKKKTEPTEPAAGGETVEPDSEMVEPEKVEASEEASVVTEAKEQKQKLRNRNRSTARGPLPKVIFKRKKSASSYWVWAVPAASVLVLMLVILACYYYL